MGSDPISYRLVFLQFRENYGKVIFAHYFLAPIGIVTLLFFAYLTDMLIDLLPFTFPAQGICMIILFILLISLHRVSPRFLFHHVYSFLQPAADFLLACMGLFFTSSFILIPSRDPMPLKQIGLIAAFFLPSFFITWVGTVGIVKAIEHVFPARKLEDECQENKVDTVDESHDTRSSGLPNHRNTKENKFHSNAPASPDLSSEDTYQTRSSGGFNNSPSNPGDAERFQVSREANPALDQNPTLSTTGPDDPEKYRYFKSEKQAKTGAKVSSPGESPDDQSQSREERLALKLEQWFDPSIYLLLFIIGLLLFFTPGGEHRSLPLFTGVVSLSWIFSRRVVPAKWQTILHPILLTSFITVFLVWGFGAAKGLTLQEVLHFYSTGANYLILFRKDEGWTGSSPGAGDLLSSLLVGGIVSLAFPMFKFRQDLYNNYLRMLGVVAPNCVASLLLWPWLAHLIGISGDGAITFAGRFMSTPFGIQFIVATGGDGSLIVVLICITGILAVLIRDPLFRLCRTRVTVGSDEYFTIGCTIGIVAAAIGTSSLMTTHSRAAATSTVIFVLYGLALLALVAVPPIAEYVARLSGL